MSVRARTLLGVAMLAATAACGGGQGAILGASPLGPAGDGAVRSSSSRALPADLDASYVLALSSATPDGRPKVWTGGPFHHCVSQEISADELQPVIDEMSALTGIPQTTEGPCNVEWVLVDAGPDVGAQSQDYAIRYALHESGHVLGLSHSPRAQDAMAVYGSGPFTADELRVIAWMYGR
jgi:hypothetical protein